jgi:hypothetical protein
MTHESRSVRSLRRPARPAAVILGINEIASAIAVRLHRAGYGVVMFHDPNPPVTRRGMSFFDALYDDPVVVAGLMAVAVDNTIAARAEMHAHERVVVTKLGLSELFALGEIAALIDARMQKKSVTPDLRHLAKITIGLGPGFTVGANCDVAIETRPGQEGIVLSAGRTEAADGINRKLGGLGRERFIYSEEAGRWRTALDVGKRVFKGFPLGRIGSRLIEAPMDGILRGIARDDIDVPAGVKVIEIDPRGRKARWMGIDERGHALADATRTALNEFARHEPGSWPPRVRLVHSR